MRIALAAGRTFGLAAFTELIRVGHQIPLVASGVGDRPWVEAKQRGLTVRERLTPADVADYGIELIVGAHYHRLIGPRTRAAAQFGALVGHPSLLPRHRGRSAIEWTIRHNDPIAGFTWFLADDGYDTGPIVYQSWCHVAPGWSASDLWRESLFDLGIESLADAVSYAPLGGDPQDSRFATWEPPIHAPAPQPAP